MIRMQTSEYNAWGLDNANGQVGHPSDYGNPSLFQPLTSEYKQDYFAGRTEDDRRMGQALNAGEAAGVGIGSWLEGFGELTTVARDIAGNVTSIWTNPDTGTINVGTGKETGAKLEETFGTIDGFVQQARGLFGVAFPPDDKRTTKPIETQAGQGVGFGSFGILPVALLAFVLYKAVKG